MPKATLNEAEMQMARAEGPEGVMGPLTSLRKRLGLGHKEALGVVLQARASLLKAPPPEAPVRPPPPSVEEGVGKPACFGADGYSPNCGPCTVGDACRAAQKGKKKPMDWPDSRLCCKAKAGKYNSRVTVAEVYAMTRGEAEAGAVQDAITSVLRWGIPLTIHLGTEGKTEGGRKKAGRRIRISRKW